MRLELPGGGWVEYRDQLKGADQTAVQGVLRFVADPDAPQEFSADVLNRMHDMLLSRIITSWSFPEPVPAALGDRDKGAAQVGEVLDIDDYNAVKAATEKLLEKVNFGQAPQT